MAVKTKQKINVFWFRRDLRLNDNVGLFWSLKTEIPTLPLFIFDKRILKNLDENDLRVCFIHKTLAELKEKIQSSGSDILILHDNIESAWKVLLENYDINSVFTNEDYEPQAIQRDKSVERLLKNKKVNFNAFKDHCIFSQNDILKKDGTPYTVYTPYKNKWLETFSPKDLASYRSEKLISNFIKGVNFPSISLKELGFVGNQKIKKTIPPKVIKKSKISQYHETRDIPSLNGTSKLSIHLRFGTLSIRKAAQVAWELNQTWLSELIWREFFMQIMFHFPHSSKKAFKQKYENIKWRNNKAEFRKWCEGKTGFPIVDAGMRELNQTGFMHNRVRMIVASFLIKDLLIDWRWGEKFFAQKLLDYELSSNNGNWQWAAGTGCDASPYFRIFNPMTQAKKFDPDYVYIRRWVPEFETPSYPAPMVDHNMAYHRAILTYKSGITN